MNNNLKLIEEILNNELTVNLATCANGVPWCSALYFVHDDELNIYWKSSISTRHTQELLKKPTAAVTINSTKYPSSGIQASGRVELVSSYSKIASLELKLSSKRIKINGLTISQRELSREDGREWYCFKPELFYLMHEPTLGYNRVMFKSLQ